MLFPRATFFSDRVLDHYIKLDKSFEIFWRNEKDISTPWLNSQAKPCIQRNGYWNCLKHPLSCHIVANRTVASCQGRSFQEWSVIRNLPIQVLESDFNPGFLCDLIRAIHLMLSGTGDFRQESVRTEPDRVGEFVTFPSHKKIINKIIQLDLHIIELLRFSKSLAATVALVFLTSVHPFIDGNGRTARIVFNILLGGNFFSNYFPLYELSACSQGGFLIRIREAQHFGRYEGMADFCEFGLEILEKKLPYEVN